MSLVLGLEGRLVVRKGRVGVFIPQDRSHKCFYLPVVHVKQAFFRDSFRVGFFFYFLSGVLGSFVVYVGVRSYRLLFIFIGQQ